MRALISSRLHKQTQQVGVTAAAGFDVILTIYKVKGKTRGGEWRHAGSFFVTPLFPAVVVFHAATYVSELSEKGVTRYGGPTDPRVNILYQVCLFRTAYAGHVK